MKALRVSLLMLLLSAMAFAAPSFQCNQPVNDLAGVLGSKAAQVAQAASTLNSRGADTRIATVTLNGYSSMDAWAAAAVKNCPSMQSPAGGVKSTLVLIAVAPTERKMGIYTGKAFESAFGADRMLRYKTQFMGPHFKAQEWAEGLIAGANQMADRLAAYTSEVNTPVTNTTVNQAQAPTDMHGLWVFFWIVGGLVGIVIIFLILAAIKKSKEDAEEAQQSAIAARTRVTNLMTDLTSALGIYAGNFTGKPGAAKASSVLDEVSQQFSSMASKLSCDPTQEGLGAGTYRSIGVTYSGMATRLTYAKYDLSTPEQEPGTSAPNMSSSFVDSPTSSMPGRRHSHTHHHSDPQPVAASSSSDGFVEGVVLGSVLSRPGYSEPDRSYREPERTAEPEFSSSSGSSDFSSSTPAAEPEPEPSSSFSESSGSSDFSSSSSSSDDSSSSFSSSSSDSSFSSDSGSSFSSDSGGGGDSSSF